jgi:hypothetical protein
MVRAAAPCGLPIERLQFGAVPVARLRLEELVTQGLTQREIAAILDVSQTTVRYWLNQHDLKTHNKVGRRPIILAREELLTCQGCSKEYKYIRTKTGGNGSSTKFCASCQTNRRRFTLRGRIVARLGGECSICGYSECFGALDVHHLDPSMKSFHISGAHSRGWTKILEELDKCVLLCSNCHRKEHHDCNKYQCPCVG